MAAKTYVIRPDLRLVRTGKGHDYLLGESQRIYLSERNLSLLLSMVDGVRTDEDIADEVISAMSPAETYYAFLSLADKGLIMVSDGTIAGQSTEFPPEDDRTDDPEPHPDENLRILNGTARERSALRIALRNAAKRFNPPAVPAVELLLCSDYFAPSNPEQASRSLAEGRLCYPIKLSGKTAWIGPLLGPRQAPCFECLIFQLRRNRPVESYLQSLGVSHALLAPPMAAPDSGLSRAARFAAGQLASDLSDASPPGIGALYHFDTATGSISKHIIGKRPQCPVCGKADLFSISATRRIELRRTGRLAGPEGGYRSMAPEQTWDRLKHLIDPISGIILRVEPESAWNPNLGAVHRAGYHALPPMDQVDSRERFIRFSYGKGKSSKQARTSALCEAIERHAAMYQGDEPVVRGSYLALEGAAVDPRSLQNFSDLQYAARKPGTDSRCRYSVPARFSEDMELDWTHAWSMTWDRSRLIPAAYGFAFYPVPEEERVSPFNSNGNAAGNSLEEAVLQGFLELVERDAVAIWWYNRLRRPGFDIGSFGDAYLDAVHREYAELGWSHWILDLTHDFNIPVAASLAFNGASSGYILGMGCHLDPHLAVQRAVTEMNQVYDAGGAGIWKESEFENSAYLHPDGNVPPVPAGRHPRPPQRTLDEDVGACIAIAKSLGLETIVQDYTRPDVDLRTVKVIVPGLRHFWQRLGPGRLYDVPVRLGWIPRKLKESELNPKPLEL